MDYECYVTQDKKYYRSEELEFLKGDPTKIKKQLNWKPSYTFESMLDEMIEYWHEYYV
jgi:GDPmannose 4,6-dehydratase